MKSSNFLFTFVLSFQLLFLSPTAFSQADLAPRGGASTGGGNAVVCFNNKEIPLRYRDKESPNFGSILEEYIPQIVSVEALDLFDAKMGRGFADVKPELLLLKEGESTEEFYDRITNNFQYVHPLTAKILRFVKASLPDETVVKMQKYGVGQVDDSGFEGNLNREYCVIATMATQKKIKNRFRIDFDKRLFLHTTHSKLSQAVMVLHERLYWFERNFLTPETKDSSAVRMLVSMLISVDPKVNLKEYSTQFTDLGFTEGLNQIRWDPVGHVKTYEPLTTSNYSRGVYHYPNIGIERIYLSVLQQNREDPTIAQKLLYPLNWRFLEFTMAAEILMNQFIYDDRKAAIKLEHESLYRELIAFYNSGAEKEYKCLPDDRIRISKGDQLLFDSSLISHAEYFKGLNESSVLIENNLNTPGTGTFFCAERIPNSGRLAAHSIVVDTTLLEIFRARIDSYRILILESAKKDLITWLSNQVDQEADLFVRSPHLKSKFISDLDYFVSETLQASDTLDYRSFKNGRYLENSAKINDHVFIPGFLEKTHRRFFEDQDINIWQ
jgi:hypothetical protein